MRHDVSARGVILLAMILALAVFPVRFARGDSAVVLPKGYGFLNLEDRYLIPTTERYNQNGDAVPIGSDFSRDLSFLGFPAGTTTSQVDIKRHMNTFRPLLAYGVTDRLTAGVIIPYIWAKNEVKANVTSVIPGIDTEFVQNALGTAFGLKRIETRETEGFGDIEFGARYQYYRSESFRAAFTGITIAPTGKRDDIDDLVDIPTGDGNWAIRFQFQQDFMKQKEGLSKRLGFPEVGDYFINTTFEYLYNLPDTRTVRACSPLFPVCTQKAKVTRKAGDIVQAELQGNLGVLTDGLILIGGYNYQQQFKAHFTGDQPGLPYGDLSIGSNVTAHEFFVGMTFSTVPLVVKGKFPMPVVGNIQYRERFAGENAYKTQTLWFTISTYFDVNALIGLSR